MKFKEGDIVTCIINDGYENHLFLNKDYVVSGVHKDEGENTCIIVKGELHDVIPYAKRFVLSKRHIWNEQIKELINET